MMTRKFLRVIIVARICEVFELTAFVRAVLQLSGTRIVCPGLRV